MVKPNLSILILTHKRPKLFERCLNSVMSQYIDNVEIIVNNDSCDIRELFKPNVKYYYNTFDNISKIYEFLLLKSTGKYIYYLEDDDYLRDDFLKISLDADIIAGNYFPTYKPNNILDLINIFTDSVLYDKKKFTKELNLEHLQLGQFIFKREVVEDFIFHNDNNIHNDIRLVFHATSKSKLFKTTSKIFYYQTTDGKDNISFPNTKKDINVTQSMDFLKQYEAQDTTS
jgi:glycosyltransferase involved in cell wall biosynthesis